MAKMDVLRRALGKIGPKGALYGILLLALVLRVVNLGAPISGYHSWKESETASMAIRFLREGDIFAPRSFHDAAYNGGVPFAPWIIMAFFKVFGFQEWAARLPMVAFGVATVYLIYRIALVDYPEKTALAAAFFLAVSPMHVYFTRNIQPEPVLLFFMMLSVYYFVLWKRGGKDAHLWYASAALAAAMVAKFIAMYLLMAYALFILVEMRNKNKWKFVARGWAVLGASLVPLAVWVAYLRTRHFADAWIHNYVNYVRIATDYHTYVLESLNVGWGANPVILALFALFLLRMARRDRFVAYWFAGGLAYVAVALPLVFANDYYLLPLMPTIALGAAIGLGHLPRWVSPRACIVAAAAISLVLVGVLYSIQHPYADAGKYLKGQMKSGDVLFWIEGPSVCMYADSMCVQNGFGIDDTSLMRSRGVTAYVSVPSAFSTDGANDRFMQNLRERYVRIAVINGSKNIFGKGFRTPANAEYVEIYRSKPA